MAVDYRKQCLQITFYTVDLQQQLMNSVNTQNYDFFKVCLITVAGSTGFFTWGYTNSISNCILPFMAKSLFPLRTISELSLVASIISIGAAIGAFFGSSIADKYGRRFSLLISDYVFFIGILLTLIHHFETIIVGRILQGIMIGIYSTVGPLYLIQMSPKSVRGVTGTLNFFVLNLANCSAFIFGLWFPGTDDFQPQSQAWRWAFGLCSIPLLIRIIIFNKFLIHETPYFMILKQNQKEAKHILGEIVLTDIQQYFQQLINDHKIQQNKNINIGILDLFGSKFRNCFVTGIIVAVLFQLSGLSAMMVFPDMVFQAGLDSSSKLGTIMSIIMGIINIFSKLAATFAVQKLGRRPPLVYGLFVTAFLMLFYSLIVLIDSTSNIYAKLIMMIWPLPFSLTVGGIAVLYISQILPGIGISLCIQALWISSFLIVQYFLKIQSIIGLGGVFMGFSICSFIGAIYLYFYSIETKGKSKNQIIIQFMERGIFPNTQQAPLLDENSKELIQYKQKY